MTKILFLVFLFMAGCGNFFDPKHRPLKDSNIQATEGVLAFAEVREKVLSPFCMKCHIQYGDYDFVKQDLILILSAIEQNRMPKSAPPLSSELKVLLRQWVDAGAPNTTITTLPEPTQPVPDVLVSTWDSLSKKIFTPKCVVCHSPTGEAPWVDLSSRAAMHRTLLKHMNFKEPEKSNLIIRLSSKDEPMPPLPPDSNIPQLTDEEVNVVIEWIRAYIP